MGVVHKCGRSCDQQCQIGRHTFVPKEQHDFIKARLKTRKSNKTGIATHARQLQKSFQTAWCVTFPLHNLCCWRDITEGGKGAKSCAIGVQCLDTAMPISQEVHVPHCKVMIAKKCSLAMLLLLHCL